MKTVAMRIEQLIKHCEEINGLKLKLIAEIQKQYSCTLLIYECHYKCSINVHESLEFTTYN